MLIVGGLICQTEADERDGGRAGVREVVRGVRGYGDTASHRADNELCCGQQNVAQYADDAAECAVARAHGRVVGFFAVLDKEFYQKLCHDNLRGVVVGQFRFENVCGNTQLVGCVTANFESGFYLGSPVGEVSRSD